MYRKIKGISKKGLSQARNRGLTWFFNKLKKSGEEFNKKQYSRKIEPFIGGMFFFIYDAKYKDVLPYWDKFPIVIPFGIESNNFIGLNLHYLPVQLRLVLLDYLMKRKKTHDGITYMKMAYPFLIKSSKSKLIEPCIHKYLFSHMRSKFVNVDVDEWENAVSLPVQQFKKGKPY